VGDAFLPTRPYAARSPPGSPSVPTAPLIRREVRPIDADGIRARANRERPGGLSESATRATRIDGLWIDRLLVWGCLGGGRIVRWGLVEEIGDDAAIQVALHGDGKNAAEHR